MMRAYVIPRRGCFTSRLDILCRGGERGSRKIYRPVSGMPALAPSGTTISSHITTVVFDDYTRANRSAPRRRAVPPPTRASPPIKRRVRARLHRVRASRGAVVHVPRMRRGAVVALTRFGVAASAPALRRRGRQPTPHRSPWRAWEQRRHRCLWRRPWGHVATVPLRVHARAA
jgi:hypothetical protein